MCASGQALVNSKPYCMSRRASRRELTKPLASVSGLHTKAWRLAFAKRPLMAQSGHVNARTNVRFGGKADMTRIGWLMSANDPKRTLG